MPSLRMLCPTCWIVRHSSIQSISRSYSLLWRRLRKAMMIMQQRLVGCVTRWKDLLIFSASEQLSTNLQSKDITIQEAINLSQPSV